MKKQPKQNDKAVAAIKINRSRDSGKKRTDLFARLRNTEHPLDNIFPDAPVAPVETARNEPIQPVLPINNSADSAQSDEINYKPTAPVKDYQKVSNSITRDAIPNKFFKGTSKSTYDALYLKTRGAVNPTRTIKATKRELMKWTGISHVTIFKHLKHLESVGLLKIEQQVGSHNGSTYEILIPEEVSVLFTHTNPSNDTLTHPILSNDNPSYPIPYNNLVSLPYNNLVWDSMGNPVENKGTYGDSKTFFKDYTKNDDDSARAFSEFFAKISAACERISGKPISKKESQKWGILADLLILELETAARRTDSISSVPSFLIEVLRRKLLAGGVSKSDGRENTKLDTVGKPNESGEYEKKPLGEKERQDALTQLQEFAGDKFLQDFKKWYTEEDWSWLVKQLNGK